VRPLLSGGTVDVSVRREGATEGVRVPDTSAAGAAERGVVARSEAHPVARRESEDIRLNRTGPPVSADPVLGGQATGAVVQRATAKPHAPSTVASKPVSQLSLATGGPMRTSAPAIGEPLQSIPATAVLPADVQAAPVSRAPAQSSPARVSREAQSARPETTVVARSVGPAPAVGRVDPILPLLPARKLIQPTIQSTSDERVKRVTRAVWRRPGDFSQEATRPAQPVGQTPVQRIDDPGAELIAMAPAPHKGNRPASASVPVTPMPVTTVQRTPLTADPPSIPSATPVFGQLVPVSKVVARAPATTAPAAPAPPVAATPSADGTDLDDLARRLFEPISRLLRSDLRQGRERTGRLHDRRR
jgi:hypothetical protein